MKSPRFYLVLFSVLWLLLTMAPANATVHHIWIDNFSFSPEGTVVNPGDTVRWHLVQGIHTTTADPSSPQFWDSGIMSTIGGKFSIIVNDSLGDYPYHCDLHPVAMLDTLRVFSRPVFYGLAVFNEHASSTIIDLGGGSKKMTATKSPPEWGDIWGFDSHLGEAEGASVTVMDWDPGLFAPEEYLDAGLLDPLELKSGPGPFIRMTIKPGNLTEFSVNMADLGATGYDAVYYNGEMVVGSASGLMEVIGYTTGALGPVKLAPLYPMSGMPKGVIWFDNAINVTIPGGPTVMADRIISMPYDFVYDPATNYVTHIQIRASAGISEFSISGEELIMWDLRHQARGQVTIGGGTGSGIGSLVVSNIGSSGLDGIMVPLNSINGVSEDIIAYSAHWHPPEPGQPAPTGAALSILMDGEYQLQAIKAGSAWEITPDFNSLGSQTHTVNLYLDEVLNATASGVSGLAAVASEAPTGFYGTNYDQVFMKAAETIAFSMNWESLISITIAGQKAPVTANRIEIIAENPTMPVNPFSMAKLSAKDIDEITFTEMSVSSGGCCDTPGDANDDGSANVGDAVYLISYIFKGGPAPICLDEGDANGDCGVNVGDAVYMISYVFKGGPPPVCGCATN